MQETQQAPNPSAKPFNIQTNQQLSELLSWKRANLLTLLGRNKSEHYTPLYLRKRGESGKFRKIFNPDSLMRAVQFRILSRILNAIEIPEYIHAFEKGKSIPDMAQLHVGKAMVISLDLKDFFPSIKQVKLVRIFEQMGFASVPARTLSELCTYKSFVPQGALTSPKLSNIVASRTFGPEVKAYCDQNGFTLTIYADDITISIDQETVQSRGATLAGEVINTVSSIVRTHGFRINREKTKVMRPFQRQYVCGAVVNTKVNLQKSERGKLRAIAYNCRKNGFEAEGAKNGMSGPEFRSKVMGQLNWFSQLNLQAGARLVSWIREADVEVAQPIAASERVEDIASLGT